VTVLIDIAAAVTAALNDATLSQEFTATRSYSPVFELADLETLHVTVVAKERDKESATRGSTKGTYIVDVAVQQKVDPDDLPQCDALMALAEEIVELFFGKRLVDYEAAICTAVGNAPIYSPRHMRESRVFSSVLGLTFEVRA